MEQSWSLESCLEYAMVQEHDARLSTGDLYGQGAFDGPAEHPTAPWPNAATIFSAPSAFLGTSH